MLNLTKRSNALKLGATSSEREGEKAQGMKKPAAKGTIRSSNESLILEAAEAVFAERGYSGATTAMIAAKAGMPKPNLHYYFPTKAGLYRAVISRVLNVWLAAANSFDDAQDPAEALARYIGAKMDLARAMPLGSQVYASEIMHGAPVVQDYLETTLKDWVVAREATVREWIAAGKIRPLAPRVLFYMIWSTTQHYANAAHEIRILEDGVAMDDESFAKAKQQVIDTILGGVMAPRRRIGAGAR